MDTPNDAVEHDAAIEEVPKITEADIQAALKEAEELKAEGNEHFRAKRWEDALGVYRSAVGRLPKHKESIRKLDAKGKGREIDEDDELADEDDIRKDSADADTVAEAPTEMPPTELEAECAQARAVLNANIGACYVKLGDHKEAVAACTQALRDNSQYVKALQRRAASNEKLDTWSSLSSAQEDYNTLLELLPPTSPDIGPTKRALASLRPRVEAAQKRETAEMVDKLKGLGNSILGKFGLSTDNFQFTPNGQGGYSMNFAQR